jgi:lipoprotein-anchoring transpeptidase ErfK/SrfK
MVDYYSVLLRAVTSPDAGDAQWRRTLYDRARQMLSVQLRERQPPFSPVEIMSEQAALDAAIVRIETQMSSAGDSGFADSAAEFKQRSIAKPIPLYRAILLAAAVVVAVLVAGGLVYWTGTAQKPAAAVANKNEIARAAPAAAPKLPASKDGELAPGIDGGSNDPDQPYVFRRQPTFYRTLRPVGSIIIDKLQHYLYLIQPNNVAMRYGIAIGDQCRDLAGLRHISSMAEWPPWHPPDNARRNAAEIPGGPGNPLGARLLQLDDGSSNIHGTNAPRTIGNTLAFGCIRLVNDDIVDLYGRVNAGTAVLVD